jgi:hypothetical protein
MKMKKRNLNEILCSVQSGRKLDERRRRRNEVILTARLKDRESTNFSEILKRYFLKEKFEQIEQF